MVTRVRLKFIIPYAWLNRDLYAHVNSIEYSSPGAGTDHEPPGEKSNVFPSSEPRVNLPLTALNRTAIMAAAQNPQTPPPRAAQLVDLTGRSPPVAPARNHGAVVLPRRARPAAGRLNQHRTPWRPDRNGLGIGLFLTPFSAFEMQHREFSGRLEEVMSTYSWVYDRVTARLPLRTEQFLVSQLPIVEHNQLRWRTAPRHQDDGEALHHYEESRRQRMLGIRRWTEYHGCPWQPRDMTEVPYWLRYYSAELFVAMRSALHDHVARGHLQSLQNHPFGYADFPVTDDVIEFAPPIPAGQLAQIQATMAGLSFEVDANNHFEMATRRFLEPLLPIGSYNLRIGVVRGLLGDFMERRDYMDLQRTRRFWMVFSWCREYECPWEPRDYASLPSFLRIE